MKFKVKHTFKNDNIEERKKNFNRILAKIIYDIENSPKNVLN